MLAALELVHMNARIYDPVLGRFLSADSIIQFEGDLQSYNRYSYVLNNPLKYTDPSGNILPFIGFLVGASIFGEVTTAVIIAAALFNAAVQGAISGGIRGAIRGLVMTGISIAISAGIGGVFNGWNPVNELTNLRDFNFIEIARAFAHGITQGGLAELAGGEFGSGFAGAFAGSIVGSIQGAGVGRKFFGTPRDGSNKIVHRTVAAAIVGGTVSKIGGGKFANGAMTAAMVHLFNAEQMHRLGRTTNDANRQQIQKYASGLQRRVRAGELTSKEAFALIADYAATLYTDVEHKSIVWGGGTVTTKYHDLDSFVESLYDVLSDNTGPYYVRFDDSGFAPALADGSPQVRHAMAGIRSGYRFGAATGKSIMDFYERRFSDNQPKDYILNVRATRIGELLTAPSARPADLSSWIRKEF